MDVAEGVCIGGYRILRQIGEGGMGNVWLAEHAILKRRAAIKILRAEYSTLRDYVSRFFNEARAATATADPGIVQVFDFGFHTDGSAYLVMELLEGEPLDRRLKRQGKLPTEEALRIVRQAAGAVGAAHEHGITHRDLKPDNIFLVRDAEVPGGERAKVLDFGIAKLTDDLAARPGTNPTLIMGTPQFMSPEQCRGAGEVDQRSDVYALGCVLYALVTGQAPFEAKGAGDVMALHLKEPPPRPSLLNAGLPAQVEQLILRCLAKEPADRFASGATLALAIDAILRRSSSTADTMPLGPTPTAWESAATLSTSSTAVATPSRLRRRRRNIGLGAVVAAAALTGAIAWLAAPDPAPHAPAPPAADLRPEQARAEIRALLVSFLKWSGAHAGAPCPTSAELGGGSDPWGKAYETTCADQPADQIIGVRSSGPDGARETGDDVTSWAMGRDTTELVRGKRWAPDPVVARELPPPIAAPEPAPAPAPGPAAAPTAKPRPPKPAPPRPPAPSPKDPRDTGIVDRDGDGIPDDR